MTEEEFFAIADGRTAIIGDPNYSGVWQPTGELFEVMFRSDGPYGTFYLRERQTSLPTDGGESKEKENE